MAAIKPALVLLELVFSIMVIGHLMLRMDGDNKYPVGHLYRKEEPSSRIVRMEHPFFTLASGMRFMILLNDIMMG